MELEPLHPDFKLGAFPAEEVHAPLKDLLAKTDDLPIPPKANFRERMVAVRAQGYRGTCCGHAGWGAKMAQQAVLFGWTPKSYTDLSVAAIYNRAKTLDGNPTLEGTWGIFIAQALQKWGTVREVDFPYIEDQVGTYIPQNLRETTAYKIADYAQSSSTYGMRRTVSAFGPSLMIVGAPTGLFYPEAGGMVRYDPAHTYLYGYHAIVIYGYDDDRQEAYFLNSWGTGFGDHGFGTFTYEWLDHFGYDVWGYVDDFGGKISGDLDGSSTLNVLDAHVLLNMATGSGTMTEQLKRLADVNGDGKVDVRDAVRLLQKAVGL